MKLTLPRSTFCIAILFALGIMSTAHQASSAPPPKVKPVLKYTFTPLGTLGGNQSYCSGMNNNSDVVGQSATGHLWSFIDPETGERREGQWHHAFLSVKDTDPIAPPGSRLMIDLHDRFEDEGLIDPFNYVDMQGWFVAEA